MSVAEGSEAMIDRYNNDVAEERQLCAVKTRRVSRTSGEAASVERNEHRSFGVVPNCRRPDIEHQAVLSHTADLLVPHDHHSIFGAQVCGRLRTYLSVSCAFAHTGPGRRFPRRHEAVFAAGRRAVRNSLEFLYAGARHALHLPRGRLNNIKKLVVTA